jgi:hypothetical protein
MCAENQEAEVDVGKSQDLSDPTSNLHMWRAEVRYIVLPLNDIYAQLQGREGQAILF